MAILVSEFKGAFDIEGFDPETFENFDITEGQAASALLAEHPELLGAKLSRAGWYEMGHEHSARGWWTTATI